MNAWIAEMNGRLYEVVGRNADGSRVHLTDNAGRSFWTDADNSFEGTPWYAHDPKVAYVLGEARWHGGLLGGCWMAGGKVVSDLLPRPTC